MTLKQKQNKKTQRLRTVLVVVLAVALLGGGAYIAVERFFIPYNSYRDARMLLESGKLDRAAALFESLDGFMDSAQALDLCNARRAGAALAVGDYAVAGGYYARVTDKALAEAAGVLADAKAQGDALRDRTMYERAYDCFMAFALQAEADDCVARLYDSLTTDVDNLCGMPAGFTTPMLRGYKDADKFALAYQIDTSDWTVEANAAENIRLIYEGLGDFHDAAAHGFATQRLYNHRYSNSAGYYFTNKELGEWVYNLPGYRLPGYYGLYSKITNGVLYIGSDELQSWTEQFRFTFSDNDEKLEVYSYRTRTSYTLYKEY